MRLPCGINERSRKSSTRFSLKRNRGFSRRVVAVAVRSRGRGDEKRKLPLTIVDEGQLISVGFPQGSFELPLAIKESPPTPRYYAETYYWKMIVFP